MAAGDVKIDAFLADHPQLMIGREPWVSANKQLKGSDPEKWGYTFTAISSPVENMVVYQTVYSETNRALFAAALIDDQAAEEEYREQKSFADKRDKRCICPEGNCDARRTRCCVCVFANEEVCKWDQKSCSN